MAKAFFITGTDTDVGKTWVTITLMCCFRNQGLKVSAMKPVAAGCSRQDGMLKNTDALLMQLHASDWRSYQLINPYAFEPAVSPHLACGDSLVELDLINQSFKQLERDADVVLVEGAGGWYSPLSSDLTNAQLAEYMQLPVILVVGLRLGCINHAALTLEAINRASKQCVGWVGVVIDPVMQGLQANIDFLKSNLDVPLLGVFPNLSCQDFELLALQIDLKMLKKLI